jgi:DNA-directed RNA polymerase subunit E'/Rpb7
MSSDLVNPFTNQELEGRVALHPSEMDNDIYTNLKNNLRRKLEGKCNRYGFVKEIHKITHMGDGVIEAENLHGTAVFHVRYLATICIPIKGTAMVFRMETLGNQGFYKGSNGPVSCVIMSRAVNMNKFQVINTARGEEIVHTETQEAVKPGAFVKVRITQVKFNANESKMVVVGVMEDVVSRKDAVDYYHGPMASEAGEADGAIVQPVTVNEDALDSNILDIA